MVARTVESDPALSVPLLRPPASPSAEAVDEDDALDAWLAQLSGTPAARNPSSETLMVTLWVSCGEHLHGHIRPGSDPCPLCVKKETKV